MSNSILVIGGGFSGISAALEAAEMGYEVFIVEKEPFLGGRVSQLYKYFPKLCPPSCGLEIQFQRIKNNPLVKFFTLAEVTKVEGDKGDYTVTVKTSPRYTKGNAADLSGTIEKLKAEVPSEFDFGLGKRKAAYLSTPFAFPPRYMVDKDMLTEDDRVTLAASQGVDLADEGNEFELSVGAIVVATGWKPYDVTRLTNLGAGSCTNCVSNMQMERLASPSGPTKGAIKRPSDGKAPKKVAFVQCAGSRDQNHLNFCSYICCMASLKQASYLRTALPDCQADIYYIDLRTPDRYMNFSKRILEDENVRAVKGKVAAVEQSASGDVTITVEDAVSGTKYQKTYDMVVLATGMQPSLAGVKTPLPVAMDEDGFIIGGEEKGIFAAGCAKKPLDVMKSAQSATGAALKAIQTVRGR